MLERVRLADFLLDLGQHVLVGEPDDAGAAELDLEVLADVLRQLGMRGAADDLDRIDHVASRRDGPLG